MRARSTFHCGLLALTLVFVGVGGAQVRAEPLQFLVISDSLADPGNLFAKFGIPRTPPNFEGRASNGPVWAERFVEQAGFPPDRVLNLAVAGATTGHVNVNDPDADGLLDQLETLIAVGPEIDEQTLVVVGAGGNDLFEIRDPTEAGGVILQAMANIQTVINGVVQLGGRRFLVPNLPDLGKVPAARLAGPEVAAGATAASVGFNGALDQTVAGLRAAYGVEITILDLFAIFEEVTSDPARFGFTNVVDPCLETDFSPVCEEPESTLFWDIKHPNRRGHELIADRALALFFPVFIRGDCNGDGVSGSIDDAIFLLRALFGHRRAPSTIPCRAACDVDGNGKLQIIDAVRMVISAFVGGPPPVSPFPECGPGVLASDRVLGCDESPMCP